MRPATTEPRFARLPGRLAFLLAALVAWVPQGGAQTRTAPEPAQREPAADREAPHDLREAYRKLAEAYVTVQITSVSPSLDRRGIAGNGGEVFRQTVVSGFFLDDRGHVVTVASPLAGAHAVVVETQGGEVELARIVGFDPDTDVGVLRVHDSLARPPEFADPRELRPGDPVVSVGNPYSLGVTAAIGHVTAVRRRVRSTERSWGDLIQVDMALRPGDQGGPVGDLAGRIAGMMIAQPELEGVEGDPLAISFVMPIDTLREKAHELIFRAKRPAGDGPPCPFLGVRARDIDDEALLAQAGLRPGEGCLVEVVFRDTAAERAGLQPLDVIKSVDGEPIRGIAGLGKALLRHRAGDSLVLVVVRAGREVEVVATLDH